MNATYRLDRAAGALFDGAGRSWDRQHGRWGAVAAQVSGEAVDAVAALGWFAKASERTSE